MRLLSLCLVFICCACTPNESKKFIVGTWEYNLEATIAELEARNASQSDINFASSIVSSFQGAQLDFSSKGEVVLSFQGQDDKGTWDIQNDGNELVLKFDNNEQISQIDYISPDTLILFNEENENANYLRVLTAQK